MYSPQWIYSLAISICLLTVSHKSWAFLNGNTTSLCSRRVSPVCASNHTHYTLFLNDCALKEVNDRTKSSHAVNQLTFTKMPLNFCIKDCQIHCSKNYQPICCVHNGTDVQQRTFNNECEMIRDSCMASKDWILYKNGECNPLKSLQMHANLNTEEESMTLKSQKKAIPCPKVFNPVCATFAGVRSTFINECLVNAENVKTGKGWKIFSKGVCPEDYANNSHKKNRTPRNYRSARSYSKHTYGPIKPPAWKRNDNKEVFKDPEELELDKGVSYIFAPSYFQTEYITDDGNNNESTIHILLADDTEGVAKSSHSSGDISKSAQITTRNLRSQQIIERALQANGKMKQNKYPKLSAFQSQDETEIEHIPADEFESEEDGTTPVPKSYSISRIPHRLAISTKHPANPTTCDSSFKLADHGQIKNVQRAERIINNKQRQGIALTQLENIKELITPSRSLISYRPIEYVKQTTASSSSNRNPLKHFVEHPKRITNLEFIPRNIKMYTNPITTEEHQIKQSQRVPYFKFIPTGTNSRQNANPSTQYERKSSKNIPQNLHARAEHKPIKIGDPLNLKTIGKKAIPCPKIFNPVCASFAGVKSTFINECQVNAENVETGKAWKIISQSVCAEDNSDNSYKRSRSNEYYNSNLYNTMAPLELVNEDMSHELISPSDSQTEYATNFGQHTGGLTNAIFQQINNDLFNTGFSRAPNNQPKITEQFEYSTDPNQDINHHYVQNPKNRDWILTPITARRLIPSDTTYQTQINNAQKYAQSTTDITSPLLNRSGSKSSLLSNILKSIEGINFVLKPSVQTDTYTHHAHSAKPVVPTRFKSTNDNLVQNIQLVKSVGKSYLSRPSTTNHNIPENRNHNQETIHEGLKKLSYKKPSFTKDTQNPKYIPDSEVVRMQSEELETTNNENLSVESESAPNSEYIQQKSLRPVEVPRRTRQPQHEQLIPRQQLNVANQAKTAESTNQLKLTNLSEFFKFMDETKPSRGAPVNPLSFASLVNSLQPQPIEHLEFIPARTLEFAAETNTFQNEYDPKGLSVDTIPSYDIESSHDLRPLKGDILSKPISFPENSPLGFAASNTVEIAKQENRLASEKLDLEFNETLNGIEANNEMSSIEMESGQLNTPHRELTPEAPMKIIKTHDHTLEIYTPQEDAITQKDTSKSFEENSVLDPESSTVEPTASPSDLQSRTDMESTTFPAFIHSTSTEEPQQSYAATSETTPTIFEQFATLPRSTFEATYKDIAITTCRYGNVPICAVYQNETRTFDNMCGLMLRNIFLNQNWTTNHEGPCQSCIYDCDKRKRAQYEPLCVSRNGVNYTIANQCYLNYNKCLDKESEWNFVSNGECVNIMEESGNLKTPSTTTTTVTTNEPPTTISSINTQPMLWHMVKLADTTTESTTPPTTTPATVPFTSLATLIGNHVQQTTPTNIYPIEKSNKYASKPKSSSYVRLHKRAPTSTSTTNTTERMKVRSKRRKPARLSLYGADKNSQIMRMILARPFSLEKRTRKYKIVQ